MDHSLKLGKRSVCVARSTQDTTPGKPITYLFACDSSKTSVHAFCTLVHRMIRPKDRVLVAHMAPGASGEAAEVLQRYQAMMERIKVGQAAVPGWSVLGLVCA